MRLGASLKKDFHDEFWRALFFGALAVGLALFVYDWATGGLNPEPSQSVDDGYGWRR